MGNYQECPFTEELTERGAMISTRAVDLLTTMIRSVEPVQIDAAECNQLQELGLVVVVDNQEYARLLEKNNLAERCFTQLAEVAQILAKAQTELQDLERLLGSISRRFFTTRGMLAEARHRRALLTGDGEESIAALQSQVDACTEEFRLYEDEAQLFNGLRAWGEAYCAVTALGKNVLAIMGTEHAELGGDLAKFAGAYQRRMNAIRLRQGNYEQLLGFIAEAGMNPGSDQAKHFATILSLAWDAPADTWEHMYGLYQFCMSAKVKESATVDLTSLLSVLALCVPKHAATTAIAELSELKAVFIRQGYEDSAATLRLAALLLHAQGTAKERFDRFKQFKEGLHSMQVPNYWVAFMAAHPDAAKDCLSWFYGLLDKLRDAGYSQALEQPAVIAGLLNAEGDVAVRVQRFSAAFSGLAMKGWKGDATHFESAAVIAALPGQVAENVEYLYQACRALPGVTPNTSLALAMVGGSYRRLPHAGPHAPDHSEAFNPDSNRFDLPLFLALVLPLAGAEQLEMPDYSLAYCGNTQFVSRFAL